MVSNLSDNYGQQREQGVTEEPLSDKPIPKEMSRHRCWCLTFFILLLLNIYCISFFFAYHRLNAMWYLVSADTKPEEYTGPTETTILKPSYEKTKWVGDALYITYYPIHRYLKYKNWADTLKNMEFLYGDGASSE